MGKKVLFKKKGAIGTITLNNPKQLNAFDFEAIKLLNNILSQIEKSSLKIVIVKGSGSSFCTGGNIAWERSIGDMDKEKAKKQIRFVQKTFSKIERLPQIFIAVIHGYAVGGGNELAMACDIRIALPDAKFKHPEVSLGTIAPLGGTKRLPRLIGIGRAKYMLITGETITSKTAMDWNLIDFVLSKKSLASFLSNLQDKISTYPLKSLACTKKSVNRSYLMDLQDAFEANSYVAFSRTEENRKILDGFLKNKKD